MNYRKLRIAWSVAWGVDCLLVISLWMWTAKNGTSFQEPLLEVGDFAVYSTDGIIWAVKAPFFTYGSLTNVFNIPPRYQATPDGIASTAIGKGRSFDMQVWSRRTWFVQAPSWFPVLIAVTLGIIPWTNPLGRLRRFSLRTLLLVMTLVAVALGLAVYTLRK